MSIRDRLKSIKEKLHEQKELSKVILKTKWEIGADEGKALKKKHKEKLRRKKE